MTTLTTTTNDNGDSRSLGEVAKQKQKQSAKSLTRRDVSEIAKEINAALLSIEKKHHVVLNATTAHLSTRGKIGINIKGEQGDPKAQRAKRTKMLIRKKTGETLPEYRMRVHHKEVHLPMNILHTNVKIGNKSYEVLGLKGKAHKVLLKSQDGDLIQMLSSEFKKKFQLH